MAVRGGALTRVFVRLGRPERKGGAGRLQKTSSARRNPASMAGQWAEDCLSSARRPAARRQTARRALPSVAAAQAGGSKNAAHGAHGRPRAGGRAYAFSAENGAASAEPGYGSLGNVTQDTQVLPALRRVSSARAERLDVCAALVATAGDGRAKRPFSSIPGDGAKAGLRGASGFFRQAFSQAAEGRDPQLSEAWRFSQRRMSFIFLRRTRCMLLHTRGASLLMPHFLR